MKELNYKEYREHVLSQISDVKNIVFATCADSLVTTRLVAHLLYENTILFSTDINSFKVDQIKKNPHVAFHVGGVNIEAVASLYGHPEIHPTFVKDYGEKYPEYVSQYGYSPDDIIIAAEIKKIQIYSYDGTAGKNIIDFEAGKAYRIEL